MLRYLRLLRQLGMPVCGEQLEFPLRAEDYAGLSQAAPGLERGNYVCIHPGAGQSSQRWPAVRFAEVADELAAKGCTVVLTGSSDECELTQTVRYAMCATPLDLTGRITLSR